MRLIYADELLKRVEQSWKNAGLHSVDYHKFKKWVHSMPTIEAEPVYNDALVEETNEIIYKQVYLADNAFDIIPVQRVVRCKDCKTQQTCNFAQYQGNNGFCSLAERKDEVEYGKNR